MMPGDTGSGQPAADEASTAPALLVISPDQAEERSTPVHDWLVIGRECAGSRSRSQVLMELIERGRQLIQQIA